MSKEGGDETKNTSLGYENHSSGKHEVVIGKSATVVVNIVRIQSEVSKGARGNHVSDGVCAVW